MPLVLPVNAISGFFGPDLCNNGMVKNGALKTGLVATLLLSIFSIPTLSLLVQPAAAQEVSTGVRDDKQLSLAPKLWGQVRVEILAGFPLTNSQVDSHVRAMDYEDGDLTEKVSRVRGEYSTLTPGDYELEYEVQDSDGNKSSLTVPVTVFELEAWNEHRDKLHEQYPEDFFPGATAIYWNTTKPTADDWRLEVLKEAQSQLTQAEIEDKRQQATLKSQAIEAYEGLGDAEAADYEDFIAALRRGGAPRVSVESVTVTDQADVDFSFISAEDNEDGKMALDESNTKFNPSLDSLVEGENKVEVTVTDSDGNSTTETTTITITPSETEEPTPTEEPSETEEPTPTEEPSETTENDDDPFEFLQPLEDLPSDEPKAAEPTPIERKPAVSAPRQQTQPLARSQTQTAPSRDNAPRPNTPVEIPAAPPVPSSKPLQFHAAPQLEVPKKLAQEAQPSTNQHRDEAMPAHDPNYPQEDYAIASEDGVRSQNPVPPAFLAVMGFFGAIGAGMVVGPSMYAKFVCKP